MSAASAEASVRLAWDANPEPDIAGYRLSYGTSSGQYTTTIDVGNATTFEFFEPNTSVKYFLAVHAYNTAGLTGPYSNEISTTPVPQPLRVTSIWSSHTSPQVTGTSITFTAITTGGTAPPQFKWWIVNGATSQVGQNWSTNASFVWAPSTAGSYAVRAWARNAGNTADAPASSEAVMEMPIVINAPANAAPTVNAGPDRTITLPSSASLQGSASDDGKPSPPAAMTLSWTRVSGPGTVTFSAPAAAVPNATFSAAGTYVLQLSASDSALSTTDTVTVTVNPAAGGGGGGLIGRYYNNPAAGVYNSTLALTRTDSTVNFNWGTGSPGPGVQAENFNIEWTGTVLAPVSGQYRFSTTSDDGIRVWVNGRLMINNWTDHAPTTNTSQKITLTAGVRYSIRVQCYRARGRCDDRAGMDTSGTSVERHPGRESGSRSQDRISARHTSSTPSWWWCSAASVVCGARSSAAAVSKICAVIFSFPRHLW